MAENEIYIVQDTPASILLQIFNADGVTPTDLTGYTGRAMARRFTDDTGAVSFTVQVPATGSNHMRITLPRETTRAMEARRWKWDAFADPPAGDSIPAGSGVINILGRITR